MRLDAIQVHVEKEHLTEDEHQLISDVYDVQDFPPELYSSFIISMYSVMEKGLLGLCEDLDLKITVTTKDINPLGNGIFRAYKFLVQSANYRIDNFLWQEIQTIGKVRNILVHGDKMFFAHVVKPINENSTKIRFEDKDYFLPFDKDLYKHFIEKEIFKYGGGSNAPEDRWVCYEICPSYGYCKYLIDFRKRFFRGLYDGLLEVAKLSIA